MTLDKKLIIKISYDEDAFNEGEYEQYQKRMPLFKGLAREIGEHLLCTYSFSEDDTKRVLTEMKILDLKKKFEKNSRILEFLYKKYKDLLPHIYKLVVEYDDKRKYYYVFEKFKDCINPKRVEAMLKKDKDPDMDKTARFKEYQRCYLDYLESEIEDLKCVQAEMEDCDDFLMKQKIATDLRFMEDCRKKLLDEMVPSWLSDSESGEDVKEESEDDEALAEDGKSTSDEKKDAGNDSEKKENEMPKKDEDKGDHEGEADDGDELEAIRRFLESLEVDDDDDTASALKKNQSEPDKNQGKKEDKKMKEEEKNVVKKEEQKAPLPKTSATSEPTKESLFSGLIENYSSQFNMILQLFSDMEVVL